MMEDIPNQEMDRRLTEHFAEESRRLRAPASLWSSIRSRLAADSARRRPSWRRLFSLRQWRPVHAFAAVVVILLAGTIWAVNFAPFQGGAAEEDLHMALPTTAPMQAVPTATPAPATMMLTDPDANQFSDSDELRRIRAPLSLQGREGPAGSSGALEASLAMDPQPVPAAPPAPASDRRWRPATVEIEGGQSTTVENAGRQIISQASLSVEVEDVAGAVAQVRTIAETRGGFISQIATTGTPGRQRSDLVVRVPQGEFFDTLESIKGLGKVWAENAGSEDVTEQFIDLEARLRSALREEQSLLSLLERADTVSNILTIERELARVRSEIERLQGQINYLSRRVDLATISVALFPPEERLAEPPYGSLDLEVEDVSASVDEVKALVARVGGELDSVFISVSNGREQAGIEFSVLDEDFSAVLSQVEGQGEVTYKEIRESTGNVESEEPDSRLTVFLMERESSFGRWLLIGGAVVAGGILLLVLLYAVRRAARSR